MQIKAIVSMIALAAAAGASHAAVSVATNSNPQSDIFLAVYDTANKASFLFDTGLNSSTTLVSGVNLSFNISGDANFASFLSTVGAGAELKWNLGAFSTKSGKFTKWEYTTVTDSVVPTSTQNVLFNTSIGPQLTALTNTTVTGQGSEVAAFGTANYYGSQFDDTGLTQKVPGFFNSVGATQQTIFLVQNSNTTSGGGLTNVIDTGTVAQFNQADGVYTFSVTTAAAVPEPESYVLALIGLVAVGAVARRRAK